MLRDQNSQGVTYIASWYKISGKFTDSWVNMFKTSEAESDK